MRRQFTVLALAAAMAVGAAACDENLGSGGEETRPPDQASQTGEPQTPPPSQPPVTQPGGVLATREVQDGGNSLRIDITGLQVQGQALTLTWRITNVAAAEEGGAWSPATTMSSDPAFGYDVSGVTLVDPVNAQRYLVARTGGEDGPCACSSVSGSLYEGDTADYYATYSAPPPSVTTVNVEFPRFGAFTDVPIS